MKQQNQNQNQTKYIPPLVLDYVELETENPILAGSPPGEDPFDNGVVMTNGQNYSSVDFSGDDYNHEWQ